MVHERVGREGLDAALDEHARHRRAGIGQRAHAGDVARALALLRDQIVEERRREVQRGQPLALDGVQRGARAELGLAAEHPAARARREQGAHAHGVVERHDAERAVAGTQLELDELRERRRALGAVRARDALRLAGRARGVEHQRRLELARPRGLRRAVSGRERRARRRVGDRDQRSAGDGLGGLGRSTLDRQDASSAVVHAVGQLVGPQAPVERHEDRAEPLRRPVEDGGLDAVLEHRGNAISGSDAQLMQAARRAARALEQFGVGRPLLAVDDRDRLGMALRAGQEMLAEVHAPVPATSAMASTIGS